jgi:hypothetical protein
MYARLNGFPSSILPDKALRLRYGSSGSPTLEQRPTHAVRGSADERCSIMNPDSVYTLALGAANVSRRRRLCVKGFAVTALSIAALSGAFAHAQDKDDPKVPPQLRDVLNDFAAGQPVSATATLPVSIGYFGGQTAIYIRPEVGVDPSVSGGAFVGLAQFLAKAFNANYILQNFATLTTPPNNSAIADPIFVFPAGTPTSFNGTFIQPNILNSSPHPAGPNNRDANYSPIWQINLVYFQPGRARLLKSSQDVADAKAAGDLLPGYPLAVPVIVECSVIFTTEGGLLPTATIQELRPDGDR